jgi:hypothetical protein
MLYELLIGLSLHSAPEDGTWYDKQYPYSMQRGSYVAGIGLRGQSWSLSYEDLGVQHNFAYVCPSDCTPAKQQYHFNVSQHSHGIWAKWEPQIGRTAIYGQMGVGVTQPRSEAHSSDPGAQFSISNNLATPSFLVGAGYGNVVVNARYAGFRTDHSGLHEAALSKFIFTLFYRANF